MTQSPDSARLWKTSLPGIELFEARLQQPAKPESKAVAQVRTYLETHYTQNVSLDQLVDLSPYYLIRCFRQQVGCALHQYLGTAMVYLKDFSKDFSISAEIAGFVSVLVGFTGAGVIVFQAAQAEDPDRRYVAAVMSGVFYIVVGLFGATVVGLFSALPGELVSAIAGLALLSTIGKGLVTALTQEKEREPALITFLVTASGLTLLGIGSAFWGLLAGVLATMIARRIGVQAT
ncbi:benzoate/H(+) symporter BenE family transporter [Leptolyngbya ectocarpi]|uniref:benzoate/H(+) symporter BenE family transporter n=1 Tax=Leptolyngbya ectocarpi TaxID=1202 RepID=UPI001D144E67|nr:benzoate/H(+) symporter BenE family transporter [Leptolyngbya ectocarpi]